MPELQIAHYRVTSELGRGGMGIVYRAEDTKLDRTVALKVLPPHALASVEDRARFYREARAAAKLSHAHICHVYQVDEAVLVEEGSAPVPDAEKRPFIAMEFVDGESLAERIAKGPMKLEEAIRIASEMASALGAAHEAGIVHRDVKSGNVMLTKKGEAKVLDFGLAKTAASTQLTRQGSTLGTVAYMSPEQARGEEVDARTDLWALGVVLYEMIAGRLPFAADYEQAMLYGILNEDPEPLTAIRTGVPMQLEWMVAKLLSKRADARYQSTSDLIVDLNNIDAVSSRLSSASIAAVNSLGNPVGGPITAPPERNAVVRVGWVALVLVAMAALTAGYFVFSDFDDPEPRALTRVEIPFPSLQAFRFPSLSPTGEWMALYGFDTSGRIGVHLYDMGTGRVRRIPDSEPAAERETYFSPDGTQLVFTRGISGGVMIVTVPTGRPRRLTDAGRAVGWLDNQSLLIVDDSEAGATYRYDLTTGTQEEIVPPAPDLEDGQQDIPKALLPGSRRAFGHRLTRQDGSLTESDLTLINLESGVVRVVETGAINPEYVRGGFLMYQQGLDDGPLVVRRVDEDSGEFTGPPMDVFEDGRIVEWGSYRVAPDGSLLFGLNQGPFSIETRLFRVDLRTHAVEPVPWPATAPSDPGLPAYSPDGSKVLVEMDQDGSDTIWLLDLAGGSLRQLTFGGTESYGSWSPDGQSIWFECGSAICRRGLEEGASIDTVVTGEAPRQSTSGRYLVYATSLDDIVLRDLATGVDSPIDTSSAQTVLPYLSPDERYVAYVSSVDDGALAVRPVSGTGEYRQPNGVGGSWLPRWSADGQYIYFGTVGGVRRIGVSTDGGFRFSGSMENVVESPFPLFDVHPEGSELMVSSRSARWAESGTGELERSVDSMGWLQNWSDYLERTLPH